MVLMLVLCDGNSTSLYHIVFDVALILHDVINNSIKVLSMILTEVLRKQIREALGDAYRY
jgi:hypothetical protein